MLLSSSLRVLVSAVAVLLLAASSAFAATLHVTSGVGSGPGTLSYEIGQASDGDTVVIDPGVNPSLTSGPIGIGQSTSIGISIQGQGADSTTITANGRSSIFRIDTPEYSSGTTSVSISGLTLTGGNSNDGGAIAIGIANLILTDVTLTQNRASAAGGAIEMCAGNLNLTRVTAASNTSSGQGGVIYTACGPAFVTIVDSTIAHNSSADLGGGLYNSNGAVTLTNDTFADNSAGTSGGNIYNGGVVTLGSTILANGTASPGGNCSGSGGFTSAGYNLEDSSPSQCSLIAKNGDLIGVSPLFGSVLPADNGGQTDTLALLPASPAVDHVPSNSCAGLDETGLPRPDNSESACDIGAYELPDAPTCANVGARTSPGSDAVIVVLSCSGPPGRVTYSVVSSPSHGKLSAIDAQTGEVTYTANSGYFGPDTVTYEATDAGGTSNIATATVTVVQAPPACTNLNQGTPGQQTAIRVVLPCSGPAKSPMTFAIVTPPSHGTLNPRSCPLGSCVYTPTGIFSGSDSFTYSLGDAGGIAYGTATISVPLTIPTMDWVFRAHKSYTTVDLLLVSDLPPGVSAKVHCSGRCPFRSRTGGRIIRSSCRRRRCAHRSQVALRALDLTGLFRGAHLGVGARLTVTLTKAHTVGKAYVFRIRSSRQPTHSVTCIAPGATMPGPSC